MEKIKIYSQNFPKAIYNLEAINKNSKENPKSFVKMAEKIYEKQVEDATNQIVNSKHKIILITGPSSAGKTPTSKRMIDILKLKGFNCHLISTDEFFINREDTPILPSGQRDYENVKTVDIAYFRKFLTELFENKKSLLPHFDFIEGKRKGYSYLEIRENDLVIIEGLHAHNPLLIDCLEKNNPFRLYVTLNSNFTVKDKIIIKCKCLRFMRRIIRDYYTRGQSVADTLKQWSEVLNGEKKFIHPFKATSNCIIDTTHLYEPLVYKNYLLPIISSIKEQKEIDKLVEALSYAETLSKEYIPDNSLMWEFVQKEKK